jgi:DNA-binding transcriptional ArsR family regulator
MTFILHVAKLSLSPLPASSRRALVARASRRAASTVVSTFFSAVTAIRLEVQRGIDALPRIFDGAVSGRHTLVALLIKISIDLYKHVLHYKLVPGFAALADPTRCRIVEMLASGELPVGEIASRFEVSQPAISQHLKVLREARLVRVRVDAQKRIYQLDQAGLAEIDRWLSRVRRFWSGRLDALDRELRNRK